MRPRSPESKGKRCSQSCCPEKPLPKTEHTCRRIWVSFGIDSSPFHAASFLSSTSNQPPVRQPPALHPRYRLLHHAHRVHPPQVAPCGELAYVMVQVLRADVVKRAMVAALESRPEAFYSVRRRHVIQVLAYRVVHGTVVVIPPCPDIRRARRCISSCLPQRFGERSPGASPSSCRE